MFNLSEILEMSPYALGKNEKQSLHLEALKSLTETHYQKCPEYKCLLDRMGYKASLAKKVEDIPFLPVRLFKNHDLRSVEQSAIVKTMTSSGTTGQSVSKIYLDKETSANQTKVLGRLVGALIGPKRLPLLVIDSKNVVKDRNLFSARGAGILGFSMFGHHVAYALNDQMELDIPGVQAFLERHESEPVLLFGFTFMIWSHFYEALKKSGVRFKLDHGILVHGGGWKKLEDRAVSNRQFREALYEVCGLSRIHDYYGMVEQAGSICMECEQGFLHASIFSDILIRNHKDFSVLPFGQKGLVQSISLLPLSYPGHSLLSEDLGEVVGEDDCKCGRKGKHFKIHGRIQNAETRGCSDTYTERLEN